MVVKAIQYYSEIHQLILKEGDAKLLMDAGERTNLLRQVLTDLRTIKAYAATSYYRVKWAVKNGIIQSLNPFAAFVNQDTRIVRDILRTWQY
jgi:phosphopantetheine adenylyltransferase